MKDFKQFYIEHSRATRDSDFFKEFSNEIAILKSSAFDINPNFFSSDANLFWDFEAHISYPEYLRRYLLAEKVNVLFEGPHGIGKTDTLKWVKESILKDYYKYKVLPIFYAIENSIRSNSCNDQNFYNQLSINFIQRVIDTISFYDKKGFIKLDDNALTSINNLNEKFKAKMLYDNSTKDALIESSSLSSKLGIPNIGSIEGSMKSSHFSADSKAGKAELNDGSFSYVQSMLNMIVQATKCEFLLVLIDNCFGFNSGSHADVFRLLEAIKSVSPQKTNSNSAYFYGAIYSNFFENHNLFNEQSFFIKDTKREPIFLDELDRKYESFFKLLTLKRWNAIHHGNELENPIGTIFDSDNAFLLAAYSANGIPGRFFRILDYAYYSYANIEGRSRLNYDDIDSALKNKIDLILKFNINAKSESLLNNIANQLLERNNSDQTQTVYFNVNPLYKDYLFELIQEGCIHVKRRNFKEAMLDLALAHHNTIINKRKPITLLKEDLKRHVVHHLNTDFF